MKVIAYDFQARISPRRDCFLEFAKVEHSGQIHGALLALVLLHSLLLALLCRHSRSQFPLVTNEVILYVHLGIAGLIVVILGRRRVVSTRLRVNWFLE